MGLFKPRFLLSASQKAHKTSHIAGNGGCEQRSQPRFLFCLMAPPAVAHGYVFWNNMGLSKPWFLLSASQKAHKPSHIAENGGCKLRSQPRFWFCLMDPLAVAQGYA